MVGEIIHKRCPWCGEEMPLDISSRVMDGCIFTCGNCGRDVIVIECPITHVKFLDFYNGEDELREEIIQ